MSFVATFIETSVSDLKALLCLLRIFMKFKSRFSHYRKVEGNSNFEKSRRKLIFPSTFLFLEKKIKKNGIEWKEIAKPVLRRGR